jgi:hypothetical protein
VQFRRFRHLAWEPLQCLCAGVAFSTAIHCVDFGSNPHKSGLRKSSTRGSRPELAAHAETTCHAQIPTNQLSTSPINRDMAAKARDHASALKKLEPVGQRPRNARRIWQEMSKKLGKGRSVPSAPSELRNVDSRGKGPTITGIGSSELFEHVGPDSRRRSCSPTPPDWIGVGSHKRLHNHSRTQRPLPRRDRLTSGSAAHVQIAEEFPMNRIVSYGLRNYAIQNRPSDPYGVIRLGGWPGETNSLTKTGEITPSASQRRSAQLGRAPGSAKKMSPIGPG